MLLSAHSYIVTMRPELTVKQLDHPFLSTGLLTVVGKKISSEFEFIRRFSPHIGLLSTLKAKHRFDQPITVPLLGHSVFLREQTDDLWMLGEVFADDLYRFPDQVLQVFAGYKDLFVADIGANIGMASIKMQAQLAQLYNTQVGYVAVEPEPGNFAVLQKNLPQYLPTDSKLINAGVTSTGEGFVSIFQPQTIKHTAWFQASPSVENTGVKAVSIDQLAQLYSVTGCIDVLKIDVEGAEAEIFQRNTDRLAETKIIFIEDHETIYPNSFALFAEVAEQYGFKLVSQKGSNRIYINSRFFN